MKDQIFLGASFKSDEEVKAVLQVGFGAAVYSNNGNVEVLGPTHPLTDFGIHDLECLVAGARQGGRESPRVIKKELKRGREVAVKDGQRLECKNCGRERPTERTVRNNG